MAAIGRLRISPSDLGRRVSVRHFDGSNLTDTLGILVSWINDWPKGIIQIEKKDKSIEEQTLVFLMEDLKMISIKLFKRLLNGIEKEMQWQLFKAQNQEHLIKVY